MPFIKIVSGRGAPQLWENMVSIRMGGEICLSIGTIEKRFPSRTISVFIDEENSLLGLKADPYGRIFRRSGSSENIWRIKFTIVSKRIMPGRYEGRWDEEREMLIIKYEPRNEKR